MRIAIDGKCLGSPRAGVARYLEGLLAAIRALSPEECALDVLQPATATGTLRWTLVDLQRASGRGCDLLHLPFYYGPLWPRCPVTVAIHDILPITHPEWFPASWRSPIRWLTPRTARRTAAVVTFSHATAALIRDELHVAPGCIEVIPHGVDPVAFAPPSPSTMERVRSRFGLQRPFLLQVGAIEPRRGTDLAIAATRAVRESFPDLELVVIGAIRAAVPALESAPSWVRRIGRVDDRDLPSLYAGAAVVIAPSRGEGFDLPVLEALACGAAVVASDIDVHVEHFAPAVEFFESGSAKALADAIRRVLGDGVRTEQLRRTGIQHAARFRWEDSARAHLQLWRDVAAIGGSPLSSRPTMKSASRTDEVSLDCEHPHRSSH